MAFLWRKLNGTSNWVFWERGESLVAKGVNGWLPPQNLNTCGEEHESLLRFR